MLLFLVAFIVLSLSGNRAMAHHGFPKKYSDSVKWQDALGPCATTDLIKLVAPGGPLQHHIGIAVEIVDTRIRGCAAVIKRYLNSVAKAQAIAPVVTPQWQTILPSLSPPPIIGDPDECSTNGEVGNNIKSWARSYSTLSYCIDWIAQNIPGGSSASAAPTSSPPPLLYHPVNVGNTNEKLVYVLALATDAPTSAQLSLKLANELKGKLGATDPYTGKTVDYRILAEPTWGVAQYQQQCQADSTTAGAIVVLPPSSQSASWNVLLAASWTSIGMQIMVLDCEPTNTAYANNRAFLTWISKVDTGTGRRYNFSLSTALAITNGILTVIPNQTTTFTTVAGRLPPPGYSYQTGYTKTTNQGAGLVAAAGASLLNPIASTSLGQGSGTSGIDAQTAEAIRQALIHVVVPELKASCAIPTPTPSPDPSGSPSPSPTPAPTPRLAENQCNWLQI